MKKRRSIRVGCLDCELDEVVAVGPDLPPVVLHFFETHREHRTYIDISDVPGMQLSDFAPNSVPGKRSRHNK